MNVENAPIKSSSIAFGLSLVIVNALSAVLVVAKESYAPLIEWMKALTGHHWITHAVFVAVAYLALGMMFSYMRRWNMPGRSLAAAVLVSTFASGLIVAGFFLST